MRSTMLLFLLACASEPPTAQQTLVGPAPVTAPHAAHIVRTALAPDGSAALSVDAAVEVRLWTSLDGTSQPVLVPVRGATVMSVARRGDGGLVVAVKDVADVARVFVFAPGGGLLEVHESWDGVPWRDVVVHPSGVHLVVLGNDHAVRLTTLEGRTLARYEGTRFRPRKIVISDDGGELVAFEHDSENTSTTLYRLRVDAANETLTHLPGDRDLPHEPGVFPSLAPSLSHAVFVEPSGRVSVMELATQIVGVAEPALGGKGRFIAFDGDQSLLWVDASSNVAVSSAVDGRVSERVAVSAFRVGSASIRGRRLVAGFGAWLYVYELDARAARFLGYERMTPTAVSLSPSGRTVAWIDEAGVKVESVGGNVPYRRVNARPPLSSVLLDEEHVVILNAQGPRIVDVASGRVVNELTGPAGTAALELEPETRTLRMTHSSATFLYELDGTLEPRAPAVLPGRAARAGFVLNARRSAALLWTWDRSADVWLHTIAELRSGEASHAVTRRKKLLYVDRAGVHHTIESRREGLTVTAHRGEDYPPTVLPKTAQAEVFVSPWGRTYIAVMPGQIAGYDARTGRRRFELGGRFIGAKVAFSADGSRVAVAPSQALVVLDVSTGEVLRRRCAGVFVVRRAEPERLPEARQPASMICRP